MAMATKSVRKRKIIYEISNYGETPRSKESKCKNHTAAKTKYGKHIGNGSAKEHRYDKQTDDARMRELNIERVAVLRLCEAQNISGTHDSIWEDATEQHEIKKFI